MDLPTRLGGELWKNLEEGQPHKLPLTRVRRWRKRVGVNIPVYLLMEPRNIIQVLIIKKVPGATDLACLRNTDSLMCNVRLFI